MAKKKSTQAQSTDPQDYEVSMDEENDGGVATQESHDTGALESVAASQQEQIRQQQEQIQQLLSLVQGHVSGAQNYAESKTVSNPRPGMIVPPGTMAPEGYQLVPWDNGVLTLEYQPPTEFDPDRKRKVLAQVDEAWERCQPTDEYPDKPAPSILLVNPAWRKLFPNVMVWGDKAQVEVTRDETYLSQEGPAFRFLTDEQIEAMHAGDAPEKV